MGTVLALREGTAPIPDTPTEAKALVRDLRNLANALQVEAKLEGWRSALRELPKVTVPNAKAYILTLDPVERTVSVVGFRDRMDADAAYAKAEGQSLGRQTADVVLVSARSLADLRSAYPNYYSDTREFIDALHIGLAM